MFPLKTIDEMDSIEGRIQNSKAFREKLVSVLTLTNKTKYDPKPWYISSSIPWIPPLTNITFQAQFFKMFEDEVEHNKNVFVLLKRIMVDQLMLEFNLRGIKGKRALAKYSIVEVMFDAYSDIYTRMSFEKACKQAIKQAHARFYTKTCLSKKKGSRDGRC